MIATILVALIYRKRKINSKTFGLSKTFIFIEETRIINAKDYLKFKKEIKNNAIEDNNINRKPEKNNIFNLAQEK